ncbi:GTP pyrophosphokinase, partial [Campylobacter upsaliensis]|nr:GTP pyrophosphokinase [Campylobacter upsaliensis]EFO9429913.1 GTP pyrophosphokinase [Campylobacter upsaliensis]
INAVLVDIDSVKNLKKAYPNYFGNAKEFIKLVEKKLAKN